MRVGASFSPYSPTSSTDLVLDWTNLTAGYYVIEVSGTIVEQASYLGQVSVRDAAVPLPGTVALLGLGLSGLAAARRRKA